MDGVLPPPAARALGQIIDPQLPTPLVVAPIKSYQAALF